MDYVCPGCRYWIRLAPLKTDGGVDYGDGYRNTISWLAPGYDPSALVVSGEMQQGGPAQFEPLVILQNTELDLAPGQGGDYAFVLLDEGGKELSRTGFTPSFQLSGRYPDPITTVDTIHFAYRIEWKAGTRRIELRDAQEKALASQTVSAHTPEVSITAPKGGEVLLEGEPLAVHWSASDEDGDALTYSLAISPDGGQSWLLVESGLADTQATIDTGTLWPGGHYRVRVRATDGVNTAEDVSAGEFSVRGALRLPFVSK
jgi:hypothetical protein